MKIFMKLISILMITLGTLSCSTAKKKPQAGILKSEAQSYLPPVRARVLQIEKMGNLQRYLYIRMGVRNKGIKVGLRGYVFNRGSSVAAGKIELIEVYRDVTRARILNRYRRILPGAIVVIEIDTSRLIK